MSEEQYIGRVPGGRKLEHSAADDLWRKSGNLTMAQQLVRHESPATTARYLHPTRDDLEVRTEVSRRQASGVTPQVLRLPHVAKRDCDG